MASLTSNHYSISPFLSDKALSWVAFPYLLAYLGIKEILAISIIFAGFGTYMLYKILSSYGLDLIEATPSVISGVVTKQKKRSSKSTHYYLWMGDQKLIAPKDKWDTIQEGSLLKIYYAKRTKWLLSYELIKHG